jgi:ABC-type sugar transport system substrate-binding protein
MRRIDPGTWVRSRRRVASLLAGGALVAGGLAATLGSAAGPVASAAAASTCGATIATHPSGDGAFNSLSKQAQTAYANWPFPVNHTPWSTFKGKKGPWKLGFISFPLSGEWQVSLLKELQASFAAAKKKGLVTGSLQVYYQPTSSTATAAQQIQEVQTMVRNGVDGIFMLPFSAPAEASAIDAAGKAGVPVVLMDNPVSNSKYAIYDWTNEHAPTYVGVMKAIGGKGNVLLDGGPAGEVLSKADLDDEEAAVKACPNVHVVGTLPGNWTDAAAKTAAAQFIASHPGLTVNAVLTNDSETTGIMQAFMDAGKPLPTINFTTASRGMLSWWLQHPTYDTVGTIDNGGPQGYAAWGIMLRVLSGRGLKVNGIGVPPFVIDQSNFKKYAKSGYALTDVNEAPIPIDGFGPDSYLNLFFSKPGTPGR